MRRRRTIRKTIKEPPIREEHILVSGRPTSNVSILRSQSIFDPDKRKETEVSKSQLEALYHRDPLTFRIVQKYIEEIIGSRFIIDGGGDAEREAVLALLNRVDIMYLGSEIVRDIFVTGAGNAWCELGYNKAGNNIITIRLINPKSGIDFIRDEKDDIKYEDDLKPTGYKLGHLGFPDIEWKKNEISIRGEITWRATGNQDGRDRIAHFKLVGIGEYELGLSPIAPGYKIALIRLNIEDVVGNAAFRSGSVVAKVGVEGEDPMTVTEEHLDQVKGELEDIDQDTIWAFRRNVDLGGFPVLDIKGMENVLYYFADLQCGGTGIKLPIILQPLQRGFRGDIEVALEEFKDGAVPIFRHTLEYQIREKIFKRLCAAKRGLDPNKAPSIRFIPRQGRIALAASRRIASYARRGLIRYDPVLEKFIRDTEGLPTEGFDDFIKEWKESGEPPEAPGKEQDVREGE